MVDMDEGYEEIETLCEQRETYILDILKHVTFTRLMYDVCRYVFPL